MKAVKGAWGFLLRREVQLILGTQEEVEWTDMQTYVQNFPLPDYGFTRMENSPYATSKKASGCGGCSSPIDQIRRGLFLTALTEVRLPTRFGAMHGKVGKASKRSDRSFEEEERS